jgi:pSer/pThr/pTyr-binding forkhead associated (FHA) protein
MTQEPDGGAQAGVEAGVEAVEPPVAEAGHIRLEVTSGNAVGTVIDIDDQLLIGRSADGVGRLADDIEISRRHARIFRTDGGRYAVEDLVSTNGTYVNGRRIADVTTLEVGDWMDIGTTTLVVRICVPGPAAAVPAEAAEPVAAVKPEAVAPDGVRPAPDEPAPAEAPADAMPPTTEAEPAPAQAPEPPAPLEFEVAAEVDTAPGRLSLRFDIDLAAGTVRIHLDEESEPITVVHRDGRWRAETGD